MATGPNAGLPLESLLQRSVRPEVAGTTIDRSLRVPVSGRGGAHPANLAVWVIEPSDEQIVLTAEGDALRRVTQATGAAVAPEGTVVILHGLWHHKAKRIYVLWARLLAAQGYRCVLVDLRAHGESTGQWVSYGVHESADIVQVIDSLDDLGLINGPLSILGGSLGAATAIQASALDPRIDSVIALAPFSRLDTVIESVAEAVLSAAWLVPGPVWDLYANAVCRRTHTSLAQTDVVDAARRTAAPMLIIAAGDDEFVPARQAHAIFAVAPQGSTMHVIPGQDHRSIARAVPPQLLELTVDWLGRLSADHAAP